MTNLKPMWVPFSFPSRQVNRTLLNIPGNGGGIYGIVEASLAVYIGHGDPVIDRLSTELRSWHSSEVWHKCTRQNNREGWLALTDRWSVTVLAMVADEDEREAYEKQLIAQYCPLLNKTYNPDPDNLERRYAYLRSTGIAGLFQNHEEWSKQYSIG